MHTILENITIPFDTYAIAIFLAAYRKTCPVGFALSYWNDLNSYYFLKTSLPFGLKLRKPIDGPNRNDVNKKKLNEDLRNWR